MKSSLFKQLEQLKENQTSRDFKKTRYASILFSFEQAANFDRDTIKNIASQGIANLVIHNPSLQGLRERLFAADMDGLRREQLTAAQNQEVSEFVQEAIRDLAPFFLLEDCHKVFEYLLRNFEVHNYEAECVIVNLIPYHSTVFFVKMLQNINLSKTTHWGFMDKNIKDGMAIHRSLIAKQCVIDNAILDLITKSIIKMVENKDSQPSGDVFFNVGASSSALLGQGLSKIGGAQKNLEVSFGMLLAVETIGFAKEKKKLHENLLITLMRFLSFCLKSQNTEVFKAGLVVMLQLASSANLSSQYLTAIALDISKKLSEKPLLNDILLIYTYIYQTSNNFGMPQEVFREFRKNLALILPLLLEISTKFSISNFFLALFRHTCNFNALENQDASELVKSISKLLRAVLETESQLQEASKRLQLARILIQEIFEKLIATTRTLVNEEKFKVIAHLSTVLTEVKSAFPDQVTEALRKLLQDTDLINESPKEIDQLLQTSFSKLYLEGVLGLELSGSDSTAAEYRQLLPSLSPYHPVSAATKLKALERVEQLLGEGMELEDGEDSLQNTVGNAMLSHFRTHSYNERILETLLKSQRIQGLVDAEVLVKHLIGFLRKYYKTPIDGQITNPIKQIYKVIVQKFASLSQTTQQEAKELIIETLFNQRATVLKENLPALKTALPVFFKSLQPAVFDSADVTTAVLDSFAKSTKIEGLFAVEEELKKASSKDLQELLKLIQVAILEALPSVMPNPPELAVAILRSFRDYKPSRVAEFGSRMQRIAQAITAMNKNSQLDARPQIYNVAIEAIFFLINIQDTSIVPVIKAFIDLLGEDKLAYLLLIAHQTAKKSQERQFIILTLFINNIINSEEFGSKDFFHEILLLLPFLEISNHQVRLQAIGILRRLTKKFKKQEDAELKVLSCGDFYAGNPLVDTLFGLQMSSAQAVIPRASFHKFVKNILKHENELAGSSTTKTFSHILEKIGTIFADYKWLYKFLVENLFTLPVKELFNLALEIISFVDTKFHSEVAKQSETTQLLATIEGVLTRSESQKTLNYRNETELLGDLLSRIGKIFSQDESADVVNSYFAQVYTKVVRMSQDAETPFAKVIFSTFTKANYSLLTSANQLEFLQLMSVASSKGLSMSAVLASCTAVDPTDETFILFGENMLESFNADPKLTERLGFLAELLHFFNRRSLKYLPLLNQIYQHILAKSQEETVNLVQEIHYAISLLIALQRQILVSVVESKTRVQFKPITEETHKPNLKQSVPISSLAGELNSTNNTYSYVASVQGFLSIILTHQEGALFENTEMFPFIKELFGCLTAYSAFLHTAASNSIVELLAPIFNVIEEKSPRTQVYALRLFEYILQLSQALLGKKFELFSFIKLLLRVLHLKAKLPTVDQGIIKTKDYHFIEIEKEISKIIKNIGQKNLDYVVYGILSNIISTAGATKKTKAPKNQHTDIEFNSAINLVFGSDKLEEAVNVLYKVVSATSNLIGYYLNGAFEPAAKKNKQEKKAARATVKAESIAKGKKLAFNYGITTVGTLRSFITILLHFAEKSFQSKEFMSVFSAALVKGNFKPEISEEFASLLVAIIDVKNQVSHGLSFLQTQKTSSSAITTTKTLNASTALKKKARAKNFLKKVSLHADRLSEGLQELVPEEILTTISCRILESEPSLKTKSKILQFFYDKLSRVGSPRLNHKSVEKLKDLLQSSLVENKEVYLASRTADHCTYLQSVFLAFSVMLKKKGKVFEDGIPESIIEYLQHPVFPVRCSLFYAMAIFAEKFQNKALENLPEVATELLYSVLLCIKYTEPQTFENIVQFAATNKTQKVLQEIATRAQSDQEDSPQSPESCIILSLNSLVILIKVYEDMMNPYIPTVILMLSGLSGHEERVEEILALVIQNIEARNLVEPLSVGCEVQNNFPPHFGKRIAVLVGRICESLDSDTFESKNQTLFKVFLRGLDYVRVAYQDKEESVEGEEREAIEGVQSAWTDSFTKFALKTNEVQLKKYFLKLNEWSSKGMSAEEHKFSILRKVAVYELVGKLFDTLRSFFVPYMGFFFDFCLDQLVHYGQAYKVAQKGLKRRKAEGDVLKIWETKLHIFILQTFTKCFAYDKENDFIDSSKFEKLVDPLVNQLDCIGISIKYEDFVADYVQPAILQLFEATNDDYKWKTLNYAILMKTRSEVTAVKLNTVKLLLKIIEQLKERTAVLIHEILPFLSETLEDENIEIEKASKEIVVRLEQITGENIQEYLKS